MSVQTFTGVVPINEVVSLPNESTSDTFFISHHVTALGALMCEILHVFSVSQYLSVTSQLPSRCLCRPAGSDVFVVRWLLYSQSNPPDLLGAENSFCEHHYPDFLEQREETIPAYSLQFLT